MKLGNLEDALEVAEGQPRQAYKSVWRGKTSYIVFDDSKMLPMILGRGVIKNNKLRELLNAAYFEGYLQRIREEL